MNYRLLCTLCLLLGLSGYVQAEELSVELSSEPSSIELSVELSDGAQTPIVLEDEQDIFDEQGVVEGQQNQHEQNAPASWAVSLGQYTRQQMAAFVAGSLIVGYGAYKAYQAFVAWYFPYSIQLTIKQRDILLTLTETMGQDVKQARMGIRKPSLVKALDMSGLGAPLDIECRYWQHNFVMLYNQCENNTDNIDLLAAFYADFNQAIKDLISKARIV